MNMSQTRRLVFFFLVFILGYFLLLFGLYLVWVLLTGVGVPNAFLVEIGSLAAISSSAAIIAGGYIAFRQLGEIANSRHLDVADRLFEELNSSENIVARRWIFQNLPDDPQVGLPSITPEGQEAVKRVLNSLDHVAFLTQAGWIPPDLVMPWMHPMIAKSWEKLKPYVEYERKRRNEPYYYERNDELAAHCHAWRLEHLEEIKVKWVQDAL
jgi:hypothetical protein